MQNQLIKKQEIRWSYQTKGKNVLNVCTRILFLMGFALGFAVPASANPTGGSVVSGSAAISSAGNTLTVNQASQKALINWNSFDIAGNETTQFVQPNAQALAINRVFTSGQASKIDGALKANGQVIVINPNGVLIGHGAHVDTNGFVATTADLANNDISGSVLNFSKAGNAGASVVNEGTITAGEAGLVGLVAPNVRNDGVIVGSLSKVQLGATDTFGLDLYGDGLINLAVGESEALSAENTGSIEGAAVLLTAAAANEVVTSSINNEGVIRASDLAQDAGGDIILTGAGANVTVSGTLDASGANGGGKVLVGGDYQGQGTVARAKTVTVTKDATVDVSATQTGNGGKAIVWSDENTNVDGAVLAKGGAQGGDGGLVETSSKQDLTVNGVVDASAANGESGTWLIDPTSVTIKNGNGTNGANTFYEQKLEGSSVNGTNVSISATGDITLENLADNELKGGKGSITLAADNAVVFNDKNDKISTTSGAITISAKSGGIDIGSLTSTNGAITLTTTNGGDIDTRALTINSGLGGKSSLTVNSAGALNVAGNVSVQNDDGIATENHSESYAKLWANDDVNVTGSINVTSKDHDQPNIGATSTLDVNSAAGGVNIGSTVTVTSDSYKDGSNGSGDYPGSKTSAKIAASGDIVIGGAVTGTATNTKKSSYSANTTSNALVSITSTNGGLWLAGGANAPKAVADGSTQQKQYDGSAYDQTTTTDSGRDVARLILSGKKTTIKVKGDDKSKTYGDADPALTYTVTDGATRNGDTFSGSLVRQTGENVGTYQIQQGTLALGVNYNLVYTNGALTIDPKTLSLIVNAIGQNKTYDGTTDATVTLTDNHVAGDNITVTYGDADFVTKNAGNNIQINVTGIQLSGEDSGNYVLANTTATAHADILKKELTASISNGSSVYGETYSFGTLSALSGIVGTDAVSVANATVQLNATTVNNNKSTGGKLNAGTYNGIEQLASNALTGAASGNYTLTVTGGNYTVTQKALSGTISNASSTYGDALNYGTLSALNGLMTGDVVTPASVTLQNATYSSSNHLNAGSYTEQVASISGTDAGNYAFSGATGTYTVNQKALSAAISAGSSTYGSAESLGSVSALSGKVSGDSVSLGNTAVQLSAATTAAANKSTSGNLKAGTYAGAEQLVSNTLTGTDKANYSFSGATGDYTVNQKALTGSISNVSSTYGDAVTLGTLSSLGGLVDGDVVTSGGVSLQGAAYSTSGHLNAGSYTEQVASVGGADAGNYSFAGATGTYTVNQKAVTLNAVAADKQYDGDADADGATLAFSGKVGNDAVDLGAWSAAFADKNVARDINGNVIDKTVTFSNISLTGTDAANYAVASSTTDAARITPKTITATLAGGSSEYGQAVDLGSLSDFSSQLIGSDVVTADAPTLTGATYSSSNHLNAGSYTETVAGLGGADAGNYAFAGASADYTVTAKALSGSIATGSSVYGDALTPGAFSGLSGVLADDIVDVTNGTVQVTKDDVSSTGNLTAGYHAGVEHLANAALTGHDAGNYTFAGATGNYAVSQKSLGLTAHGEDKIYDGNTSDPGSTLTITSGSVGGDDVALSNPGPGSFDTPDVGDDKTVTFDNVALTGKDAGNYAIGSITGGASVWNGEEQAPSVTTLASILAVPAVPASGPNAPYIDIAPLARPIISVSNEAINYDPAFEARETKGMNVDVSIRGTSGSSAAALAGLEPAAGDADENQKKKGKKHVAASTNPADLSKLEPAAGGNTTATPATNNNFAFADDFLDGKTNY